MTIFTVTFTNLSKRRGSAYLMHRSPAPGEIFPLVWFAQPADPGTTVNFQMYPRYHFFAGQTGVLKPGVMFQAADRAGADPDGNNTVTLGQQGGRLQFERVQRGQQQGSLLIRCDSSIPLNQVSVGIGMSGEPVLVTQAQPGMSYIFTPKPVFNLVFRDNDYRQGQVLDNNMMLASSAEVDFSLGNTVISVTLTPDERLHAYIVA